MIEGSVYRECQTVNEYTSHICAEVLTPTHPLNCAALAGITPPGVIKALTYGPSSSVEGLFPPGSSNRICVSIPMKGHNAGIGTFHPHIRASNTLGTHYVNWLYQ